MELPALKLFQQDSEYGYRFHPPPENFAGLVVLAQRFYKLPSELALFFLYNDIEGDKLRIYDDYSLMQSYRACPNYLKVIIREAEDQEVAPELPIDPPEAIEV